MKNVEGDEEAQQLNATGKPHCCPGLRRHFKDQSTIVDFVLAFTPSDSSSNDSINEQRRKIFIDKLCKEGLMCETDTSQHETHYVKIHVPEATLKKYCEYMKMLMPMKKQDDQEKLQNTVFRPWLERLVQYGIGKCFGQKEPKEPPKEYQLLHEYSASRSYLFDETSENFFSSSVRIAVVDFILDRTSFKDSERNLGDEQIDGDKIIGIRQLLKEVEDGEHAFYAAFPLHDCCLNDDSKQSLRAQLWKDWAKFGQFMKRQPLDDIKEYFGVKIALYFTWLGFYTSMLLPAAIVGLMCSLYGIFTFRTNRISQEICRDRTTIMCPQCDKYCGYWNLNSTCMISKLAYIFDNEGTIFFSIFISIWAALYLKLWKRYFSPIQYRWGVMEYCSTAEPQRPEYAARVKNCPRKKYNIISKMEEPSPSFWTQKVPAYIYSYSVVYVLITMTLAVVLAIIIYRMSLKTSQNLYGDSATVSGKLIIYPMTTATINLLASTVLAQVYNKVATKMTDIEYRRTQTEYNDSLSLKLYLFEFINYYSSIFYIAFVKGKLPGYPKEYNRIFNLRQEECSTGGCLMELTIQLAIIMIGKQLLAMVKEYLVPFVKQKYKTLITHNRVGEPEGTFQESNRWVEDDQLLSWKELSLFKEYLKMVIQYGFITIFAVAFPPASLFALVNNMIETRLDAGKFLKFYKRAVPERVRNLGMWYNAMQVVTKLAVISNAFIIAFSSNITHRIIYMLVVNPAHTDEGFVNNTLAYFNTSHFEEAARPDSTMFKNVRVEICRYAEYRNPPDGDNAYERSILYWKILAIRLAVMVIYQNLVGMIQVLVSWAISDMPRQLQDQIKNEQYFTNEKIIEIEKRKTCTHNGYAVECRVEWD